MLGVLLLALLAGSVVVVEVTPGTPMVLRGAARLFSSFQISSTDFLAVLIVARRCSLMLTRVSAVCHQQT